MLERKYRIEGVAPLVMHNEQLADPMNKWTRLLKEISKKVKKTDDDLMEMSRREWMGGLYFDPTLGPYVPERCLERMLRNAAARSKRGKAIVSGLIVVDPAPLVYKGSRDPDELWASGEFVLRATVGVDRKRIVRSRPIFRAWALEFTVNFDESLLDAKEIDAILDVAGRYEGLCDWRPKHGRFSIKAIDGKAVA